MGHLLLIEPCPHPRTASGAMPRGHTVAALSEAVEGEEEEDLTEDEEEKEEDLFWAIAF